MLYVAVNRHCQVLGENGEGYLTSVVMVDTGDKLAYAIQNDGRIFAWGRQYL